ncbi:MAG TPA: hypothetical protein VNA27_10330 [Rubrobacteraceae bacterium]|nr:hypothetical protein [Rubrobacteraceae bacterium]
MRVAALQVRIEAYLLQKYVHVGFTYACGQARTIEEGVFDRLPKERGELEDRSNTLAQLHRVHRARGRTVQVNLACGRHYESVHGAQQRALARPERPHDRGDLTL